MNKDSYISRGVRLDTDVWAALEGLKVVHGSYNKGLRAVLLATGPRDAPDSVKRAERSGKAFAGPLPRPSERGKK